MAVLPSILPARLFRSDYSVGPIEFDLILEEAHAMTSVVSSHPVEDGSEVADHIRNELRKGTVSGLVSNHSINAGLFFEAPGIGISVGGKRRDQEAYDAFLELWEKRELVTIVTYLQVYKNVAITSVAASRNGGTGQAQTFEISFQQVKLVRLKEVQITAGVVPGKMDNDLSKQSAFNLNLGRTSPLFEGTPLSEFPPPPPPVGGQFIL